MAHLISGPKRCSLEYPTKRGVRLRLRLGVERGRRGSASSAATATASPACCAMLARPGDARRRPGHGPRRRDASAMLDQGDTLDHGRRPSGTRSSAARARARVGAGDARGRDVISGLLGDLAWTRADRTRCPAASAAAWRWPALLAGDWRRAGPRRADQPPRRRGHRLAGRAPEALAPAAGGLVVVTHDRWFLDAVCTTTLGGARPASSSRSRAATRPTSWQRVERDRVAAATEARGRTWCARSWPGCAAARRPAPRKPKFRIDAANALIADVPPPRDTVLAAARSAVDAAGQAGRRPSADAAR